MMLPRRPPPSYLLPTVKTCGALAKRTEAIYCDPGSAHFKMHSNSANTYSATAVESTCKGIVRFGGEGLSYKSNVSFSSLKKPACALCGSCLTVCVTVCVEVYVINCASICNSHLFAEIQHALLKDPQRLPICTHDH